MTGLLDLGRADRATEALNRELAKLPDAAREEPTFVLLRGFASRGHAA